MNFVHRRKRSPITQSLRDSMLEDLPEIAQIAHEGLRSKTIEAWAHALSESAFRRVTDIPGEANPGMLRLRRGSQADHLRSALPSSRQTRSRKRGDGPSSSGSAASGSSGVAARQGSVSSSVDRRQPEPSHSAAARAIRREGRQRPWGIRA
ncbi:MAG TPA: hypothetical protein VD970_17235 [Acetobacteraceae bacterium]|nr:hypothetical protein [Acetobacteraceae bacterium]